MLKDWKKWSIAGSMVLLTVVLPSASGRSTAERLSGHILLDVEQHGEAWYVNPPNLRRYYLGRPDDAFEIMRFLSLGVTNATLAKIPTNTDTFEGDRALRQRLSGRILLQVEGHGEAWYIYPNDLKRYYLGRPADAFRIMTELGLGISSRDLATVPISTDFLAVAAFEKEFRSFTLSTERGQFHVDILSVGRENFRMVTDTYVTADCEGGCGANPLATYVAENRAQVGIHGSYFCPPDYTACSGKVNSFFSPFYNTGANVLINEDSLPFHNGPLIAVGKDKTYHYFHRAKDFGRSVGEFEQRTGTQLQAVVSNYPSLVEQGRNVVWSEPIEPSQRTRGLRGGIGYTKDRVFLVIARSASVMDLASVFTAIGAEYALNLDGGGSTALWEDASYHVGPGRTLPNAILFVRE